MGSAKRVAPKLGKPASKPTRRPQLDKMGPGENFMPSGKFYNGVALDISPSGADSRNASYAYNRNPANKMKKVAAINKATKYGAKRKGGK